MSFSADVKRELCRITPADCCCLAECYGALLYCNTFSARQIRIVTEHREFAARLPLLFRRAFDVALTGGDISDKPGKLSLGVTDPGDLQTIFSAFGYDAASSLALHVNLGVLENDCCRAAFLRGAFLAGGSVIDPEKRYHLELMTSHLTVGRELHALLLDMGLSPKSIQRSGSGVLYFKHSEAIEDVLTLMGAPVSAMALMNTKLEKELRNDVNRQVNCDTANLEKAVTAAQAQLDAIHTLEPELDALPDRLRQTARLRLDNPEATLQELAELASPPVSKSAMNHRLRKLTALAGQNER